ncbi:MAG: FAD-dependent oxidoreductase [Planctomycetota bacterium]
MIKNWKCEVCGYVHTGKEPPSTCPICGAERGMFTLLEAVVASMPAQPIRTWRCTICEYVHHDDNPPDRCPVCSAERTLFEAGQVKTDLIQEAGDIKRIVIIGAGIAGLTAVEQARAAQPDISITLISKEAGFPYFRLNLTRFLAGEVTEENLTLHGPDWFMQNKVDLIEGEAKSIDRKGQRVILHDGREYNYDRLILANGSHAFAPPIPGITLEGVLSLRTLENAKTIIERAAFCSHVACIGGGLLGLETAGALARRGLKVSVLEGFASLLPRQLTPRAGELLRGHVESAGIKVYTDVKVKEFIGDESVRAVLLQSGEEIPADMVVLATGIRPNSSLARQADLSVRTGVIVDDQMVTSDPKILACGDVAEHSGTLYGIWPASYAQGSVAGTNAAGGKAAFNVFPPSNRLKVLDVNLFSVGRFQPPDASYDIFEQEENGVYYRIVCHDNQIVGANLFGDTGLAVPLLEAIEQGRQIPELTDLLARIPNFASFCGR